MNVTPLGGGVTPCSLLLMYCEQQFEMIQAQTSETSVQQLHFRNKYIFLLGMPLLQQCYPTQYEDSCHLPGVIGSLIG
jgi:hypothetical protein